MGRRNDKRREEKMRNEKKKIWKQVKSIKKNLNERNCARKEEV